MTRQDLSQVYYLNRELEMWNNRLKELRMKSQIKVQSFDGMPFQNTGDVSDSTFKIVSELIELQADIEVFELNIEKKKAEIEHYIVGLDDSFLRQIIEYHCCQLKSWEQTAMLIGFGTSADSCKKYFYRKFPKN